MIISLYDQLRSVYAFFLLEKKGGKMRGLELDKGSLPIRLRESLIYLLKAASRSLPIR